VTQHATEAATFTVAGDELPCLSRLQPVSHRAGSAVAGGQRAIVLGVDLARAADRDDVKRELERQAAAAERLCARMPGLQQVVLVLSGSPAADDLQLLRLGRRAASRIHAQLEQSCGSYVSVTVLVAGGCDDPGLLAHRILDRAARSASIDPASALLWSEIIEEPIQEAGATDYV
jgi:hypothetical protein